MHLSAALQHDASRGLTLLQITDALPGFSGTPVGPGVGVEAPAGYHSRFGGRAFGEGQEGDPGKYQRSASTSDEAS